MPDETRYITAANAAAILQMTSRRVTGLCREGKLEGAVQAGRNWKIPEETVLKYAEAAGIYKTADLSSTAETRLPCAVGNTSFVEIASECYYVDKTLLIRDLVDDHNMVTLFTRPRRFGKTLAINMLKTFFEKTEEDTSRYFADRKIWECGYMAAQFSGSQELKRTTTPEMEKYGVAFVYEPTGNNNFLLGSSRMFAGFDERCKIEMMKLIAQRAIRFLPGIKDTCIIRSYAGVRPFVADHRPIVSATKVPGFFVAAGHEGDGICLSAVTGYMMAQIIRNEPTLMDCEPLSIHRFDQDR